MKSLRTWKDRVLALPWIYDVVRPLAVGGLDLQAIASFCGVGSEDRVFDLGCGTAQLVPYLNCAGYLGVDLDPAAVRRAERRIPSGAQLVTGDAWDEAFAALRPTVVLMIGVVHHLPDSGMRSLTERLRAAETLRRIVTLDVTYLPGSAVNNLLSRMDRGGYVRRPPQYEALFRDLGLRIARRQFVTTRLRYVRYIGYHLAFEGRA